MVNDRKTQAQQVRKEAARDIPDVTEGEVLLSDMKGQGLPRLCTRNVTPLEEFIANSPRNTRYHRYRNASKETVRFEVFISLGEFVAVEVAPGKEVDLPAEWVVHQVYKGVVVGGHAPQLVRADTQPTPVQESLTVEGNARWWREYRS